MSNFLNFHWVECKNLASVGNTPIRIQLDRSPTTVVLGKNGAGKSSLILDSVCFALYGKAFRNINKGQLVNNKNNKDMRVTIEFTRGTDTVKVVRGLKPAVFEIWVNGTMVDQSSKTRDYQKYFEEQVLGIDYNAFTQIVMIGKANYVPFMGLAAASKRQFVERVLGLDIFSTMSGLHKTHVDEHNTTLADSKADIRVYGEQLKAQTRLVDHIKKTAAQSETEKRDEYQSQIEKLVSHNTELKTQRDAIKSSLDIETLRETKEAQQASDSLIEKLSGLIAGIAVRQGEMTKDIRFFETNDTCPTCDQEITQSFKNIVLASRSNKKAQFTKSLIDLEQRLVLAKQDKVRYNTTLDGFRDKLQEVSTIDRAIAQNDSRIVELTNKLVSVKIDTSEIDKEETVLQGIKVSLQSAYDVYNKTSEESAYLSFMSMCLKDSGIKSTIIQEFIPLINSIVNQNIKQLGLFATVSIDEQFKEEIKMRGFETMSYNQMSEGEKLRLDMAVMMAWRDVARYKANMSCNLLIMDEIFDSSVDAEGTAAFADLLKTVSNLNVFVITHTPEKLADSFRSFIQLEKKDGFTTLASQGNY